MAVSPLSGEISPLTYKAAYGPFKPMIPDNAWILRITAAAGTELADPYSYGTVRLLHVGVFLPVQKQFTIHRTVFLHAAWLVQTCVH